VAEAIRALEPTRIGHGVKSAYDDRVMAMLRERGIVLEVCPSSNLSTRVVRGVDELRHIVRTLVANQVRFALSTDGPEMLRSYLRDEIALVLRHGILSFEEVERAVATAHEASFVGQPPGHERLPSNGSGRSARAAPLGLEVEV
jgi:adenosine deaminase